LESGLVVMLPGIECSTWQFAGTVLALREGGMGRAVKIVQWGGYPLRSMGNLMNLRVNRERARNVAGQIAGYARDYPGRPITLIGYSGGGGMAILTAESLPEEVELQRIILIAAAISPCYDLSAALAHSRLGLVNFHSPRDWFFLGMGTNVFGTIDRCRTVSAGRVGFRDAQGLTVQSERIVQIAWTPRWRDDYGHDGGHIGWLSRGWARELLVPWIDSADARVEVPHC
jgi:pimeloyl-ACP methyl ester carboxylesterase